MATKTAIKKTATPRKTKIVSTEPAARVKPLFTKEDVERLAYELWEKKGRMPGTEETNWLEAEHLIQQKSSPN